ncbi:hypothetical protein RA29_16495, partial [Tateyamaria sp. ANG-S1]
PNQRQKVPYDLPEHKTKSVMRTQTHKADGFNELRFEDQAGEEEIFVHAQKDRNEKVLHNHTERIDNNWIQSVGHNRAMEVDNNRDEVVGGNMTVSVGSQYRGDVVGRASLTNWQGITRVGMDYGERGLAPMGEGNLSFRVQSSWAAQVDRHVLYSVGGRWDQQITKDMSLDVGTHLDVAVAGNHVDSAGERRVIQAARKVELICGEARISLHSDGRIQLSGETMNLSFRKRITAFTDAVKITAKSAYKVVAARIDLN